MNADIAADLAPTGILRASINLGNPVLAQVEELKASGFIEALLSGGHTPAPQAPRLHG